MRDKARTRGYDAPALAGTGDSVRRTGAVTRLSCRVNIAAGCGWLACGSPDGRLLQPLAINCLAHPSGLALSPDESVLCVQCPPPLSPRACAVHPSACRLRGKAPRAEHAPRGIFTAQVGRQRLIEAPSLDEFADRTIHSVRDVAELIEYLICGQVAAGTPGAESRL